MTGPTLPDDRRYAKTHEWVKVEGDELLIGISDHAQAELTDIVFVDLPAVGKSVRAGESLLVLESVKTVADVYAPADGTVSAVNAALTPHPELVNREPYAGGWLVRLKPAAPFDASTLLDAAAYRATL
ncbi:MAG TPA: glycine cleavage system protein GcvH [Thermoplasmata archaeon]|nr:glycine cleavage system protein GcvH [Thermoplasmata archaeon]